ncbi:endonuclease/exonuclease/phosphatase family protein [Clostridium sp.]|uniref:endonuclease/exonuclease/phosphatase family protein n=1 Tax=Clostridium sp. TaxID=1506 RepID=UPI003D6D4F4F
MLKKYLKRVLLLVGVLVLFLVLYVLFMIITDYKPKEITPIAIENNKQDKINVNQTLSLLTYNIGYAGMDEGRDFFMDGGTQSRSESKEKTLENLKGMNEFIKDSKASFIFLQEVDINATRSYHINEYDFLKSNLSNYNSSLAINYKSPWVPIPILKPHGKVEAGLVTFSSYKIETSNRYVLPGVENWFKQLGDLDRCFMESRISVDDGKDLILVNLHPSAYDKGGLVRKQQLGYLKNYISAEYHKGNYLIVGGDWNHLIPGTDPSLFKTTETWPEWLQKIPEDFTPEGFKWIADKTIPTTRTDATSYVKDENFSAVIDGFLVSPNIEIENVKGYALEFKYTDHNPVKIEFKLK